MNFTGKNTREVVNAAPQCGVRIVPARRTDDWLASHPLIPLQIRFKCTRKDCPRALSTFMNKAWRFSH